MDKLENVVITGAAGALGGTLTERFLEEGCTVAGVDLGIHESPGVVEDPEHDRLRWVDIDLSNPAEVERGVSQIEEALGSIDGVVNCAGGFRWTPMDEASDEDIDFLIDANLRSALYMVRAVLPTMKEQGFGRIVLISSKSTLNPGKGEGPYAATKAALNALTESVAAEVKQSDVTINAVLPSVIDTPANRQEMADADFDRWVKREQLADIIFNLTQKLGDPINGALLPVAGRM